jgi:hypothetical protein
MSSARRMLAPEYARTPRGGGAQSTGVQADALLREHPLPRVALNVGNTVGSLRIARIRSNVELSEDG